MALKNKDGSPVIFSRPNPLMEGQNLWHGQYTLRNKLGRYVVVPDFARRQPEEELPVIAEEKVTLEDKVQVWCLPASYKEFTDGLYGDTYRKLQYGAKFLVEAVMMSMGDLSLTLWVNTRAVTEGSILYPRTQDRRWWRVVRAGEQDGGYIIEATISDYQPKFAE